jgi:hypothetical protein
VNRAAAALLAAVVLGCAGARPPATTSGSSGRQSLYRVQFEGAEGKGSFRLLLRRVSDQRFDLAASDPLGRTLWALDVVDGEGTWFDFRARKTCALGPRFRLEALQLPELPLVVVPRILSGEPPHAAGLDDDGRTWTLRRDGWELTGSDIDPLRYEEDASAAGSGTLSNRASTLRFRRVADEPLTRPLEPRQPGPGFTRGGCEAVALA